jgi:hypothetical protein
VIHIDTTQNSQRFCVQKESHVQSVRAGSDLHGDAGNSPPARGGILPGGGPCLKETVPNVEREKPGNGRQYTTSRSNNIAIHTIQKVLQVMYIRTVQKDT